MGFGELIAAITSQSEFMTSVSIAGLGTTTIVFGSMFGVVDEFNVKGFRGRYLLFVPFFLFLVAYLGGGVIASSVTGFYVEVLSNPMTKCTSNDKIVATDPTAYYLCDYLPSIKLIMLGQYFANLGGILLAALWFAFNIFTTRKAKRAQEKRFVSVHQTSWIDQLELIGDGASSRPIDRG